MLADQAMAMAGTQSGLADDCVEVGRYSLRGRETTMLADSQRPLVGKSAAIGATGRLLIFW
ncbi:hypothetical protein [Lysobacter capsici]|uniref:hypothetical protein n=1 Tax=Lysobacter capsici TaxID=435897 RepID=UPI000ABDCC7B|nr:hypothetical protein [Lysobacter capsici]